MLGTGTAQKRPETSARPKKIGLPLAVTAWSHKLWPFSNISAAVVIMNGAAVGNMSNIISFESPEGGQ